MGGPGAHGRWIDSFADVAGVSPHSDVSHADDLSQDDARIARQTKSDLSPDLDGFESILLLPHWGDRSSSLDESWGCGYPQCLNTVDGMVYWSYIHDKYVRLDSNSGGQDMHDIDYSIHTIEECPDGHKDGELLHAPRRLSLECALDGCNSPPASGSELWHPIDIDSVNAGNETKMWEKLNEHNQVGHDLLRKLDIMWMGGYPGLFDGCHIKKSTAAALRMCEQMCTNSDFVHEYTYIYIDGSFQVVNESPTMSWALAVFEVSFDMVHKCVFSTGGIIDCNSDSDAWLGAASFSSYTAEVYAGVMARMYVLQAPSNVTCKPLCIVYDSSSAADVIACRASIGSQSVVLCKVGCALNRLACSLFHISDHHIHSHEQHPWNEYVDSICTHIAKSPQEAKVRMTPVSPMCSESVFCMDFASLMSDAKIAEALGASDSWSSSKQIGLDPRTIASRIDAECLKPSDGCACEHEVLKVVQYNVQTFIDIDDRNIMYTKLKHCGIAIACFNETRERINGVRVRNGFVCCMSAASKGNHGCQVCFNLSSVWYTMNGVSTKLSRRNVSIIAYDPRYLICRCTLTHCDMYVVSAHAPFANSGVNAGQWWRQFSAVLKQHCAESISMLLCFDGNCQWFHTVDLNHGNVGVRTCRAPLHFSAMVDCLRLQHIDMHSTMYEMYAIGRAEDYGTYVPTKGTNRVRIDYIGSRGKFKCIHEGISIVDHLSRHGLCKKDHRPLVAAYRFEQGNGSSALKRRLVQYDQASFGDPEKQRAFVKHIAGMQAIPLEVENSSHCFLVEETIHDSLVSCFPKPVKLKKHEFLTDNTFGVMCRCHRAFKLFGKCDRRFEKSSLFVIFGCWARLQWRFRWSHVWGFNSFAMLKNWTARRSEYILLSKEVKSLVTLERLADIDATADDMTWQFEHNDCIGMHRSVGRITKHAKYTSSNTVTRVANKAGALAQTYYEERLAFREHFADLMQGREMSFMSVVEKDRNDTRDRYGSIQFDTCWKSIPSPTDVVAMALNAKVGKAPGENKIVGKAHKMFASLFAYTYFPLVLKMFVRIQPPIQYKGGMIYEIYKGKGVHHMCSSFRDVLLANDSGKHVCTYVRHQLLPWARKLVHSTQFGGGFNGGETSFAHLYARSVLDACRAGGLSCGILFLDVVTAFARMLRRSIFNICDGDEAFLCSLREAGFSDPDVRAIYETVASLARWDIDASGNIISCKDGMDDLSHKLAQHWYVNTWMSQEGLPGVFVTDVGCMAGTPLADLAFTVSISRILYILRKTLFEDGLESVIVISGNTHKLHDVSFVDDTACPVSGRADVIVGKVTAVAKAALGVFKCFGLDLNFSAGKSECVISHCGPGKKKAIRALELQGNSSRFEDLRGGWTTLLFVRVYKHVGTRIPFDAFLGEEVSVRCSIMRQAFGRLRKTVFLNERIPVVKRLVVLQVYVLTRGIFQACTWPTLPNGVYKKFHHCIMTMYRCITGHYHGNASGAEVISDSDLLDRFCLMNPSTLLRVARLLLLGRLALKAPDELMSLLVDMGASSCGWPASVLGDLRWLTLSEVFAECARYSMTEWIKLIVDNPKAFKRGVAKFSREKLANMYESKDPLDVVPASGCSYECNMCVASFGTLQQFSLHVFKKHGVRNVMRLYINDHTHCPVCLRLFWTRPRLLNHIRYKSKICKYNLYMRGMICSEEEASRQDAAAALANVVLYRRCRRNHFAEEPVLQLKGPLLPIVPSPGMHTSCHHNLGRGQNYHG